jgi:hypothetical protein
MELSAGYLHSVYFLLRMSFLDDFVRFDGVGYFGIPLWSTIFLFSALVISSF